MVYNGNPLLLKAPRAFSVQIGHERGGGKVIWAKNLNYTEIALCTFFRLSKKTSIFAFFLLKKVNDPIWFPDRDPILAELATPFWPS